MRRVERAFLRGILPCQILINTRVSVSEIVFMESKNPMGRARQQGILLPDQVEEQAKFQAKSHSSSQLDLLPQL